MKDSFYSLNELAELGIKKMGKNLKISKKTSLYKCEMMEFGDNVRIDDFCILSGKLVFGNHVYIACFCLLSGSEEGIIFDDFTTFAFRVTAFTKSDDYSGETLTNPTIPDKYRHKMGKEKILVGKHAIVGASSIILPGAHISEGVSVGAASFITKPTEPWGIYVGIPAKRVKERRKELLEQENAFMTEQLCDD